MSLDAPTSGRRIVVLDNDPAVLDLLVMDLRLEGHDVLAAVVDRAVAVEACIQLRPDVFVVDLRLGPGPDGIDVAETVIGQGLDLVLYTNYVNAEVVGRAHRLGMTVVEKGSLGALRRAVLASPRSASGARLPP